MIDLHSWVALPLTCEDTACTHSPCNSNLQVECGAAFAKNYSIPTFQKTKRFVLLSCLEGQRIYKQKNDKFDKSPIHSFFPPKHINFLVKIYRHSSSNHFSSALFSFTMHAHNNLTNKPPKVDGIGGWASALQRTKRPQRRLFWWDPCRGWWW